MVEAEFARRGLIMGGLGGAPVFAATFGETHKGPPKKPTQPCGSCGHMDHFRKDCPYKEYRCHNCQKIGHLSAACRNVATKDTQGRVRQMVEMKPGKIQTAVAIDNSTKDRVNTAQDVLQNLFDAAVKRANKATAKRKEKQRKSGKLPKRKKKEHPVGAAIEDETSDTESEHEELITNLLSALMESESESTESEESA
ncbi:MAG: hypothetical protein KVP17_002622 [Porospora cf. gigantea B]|uniref:uncharacterized protein n=1 Tax=Porospora cf. gigantea B TaxID=2853592 RepID=UPI003571D632|nr:MAG: hypothetical protein KVP17_002622 [Porospora cf. gigantea B]